MLADSSIQLTECSFSKNSLQPRHSVHFTAGGPKFWWSGSHSYLYTIAEVVRTLMPVDVAHQYIQFVLDTVFHWQPVTDYY